jgi:hypothetical protein
MIAFTLALGITLYVGCFVYLLSSFGARRGC